MPFVRGIGRAHLVIGRALITMGGGRSQRDVKFHPCHRDVSYWPQMSRVINAYFSESHNNLICKSLSFAVNLRTYKKSRKLGGIAAVARRFT